MHRSLLAAVGILAFAAACSDPTTGPSAVALDPRLIAGHSDDVGAIQVTLASGATTDFCGNTAANTWSIVPLSCVGAVDAAISNVNPGWVATIPGSSAVWVSKETYGDRYLLPSASYTYLATFTVDAGTTDPVLNVQVASDNGVTVYLNNCLIGQTAVNQDIFNDVQTYSETNPSCFNIGGVNYIYFVAENTRVPDPNTGLPTLVGQPCPDRPSGTNVPGGTAYDQDPGYDAILCNNPTGLLYAATVSWVVPAPFEGCSPGYWKNHNFPEGYSKNQLFSSVFEDAFPNLTLQQVLELNGGGLNALGRQTVSAYFNALTLNYEYTPQEVIDMFNAAYASGNYNTLKALFESKTDVDGRLCGNPTGR